MVQKPASYHAILNHQFDQLLNELEGPVPRQLLRNLLRVLLQ